VSVVEKLKKKYAFMKCQMKALVVHPYMSIFGGGERVCLNVVRALMEEGINVTLVSEPIDPNMLKTFLGFNLSGFVHVPYKKFKLRFKKFSVYQGILHFNFSKPKIKRIVKDYDIEFLTQSVAFTLGAGRKTIAYVHFPEFFVHLELAKPKTRWFWKFYYAPMLSYLRNKVHKIDIFICNSEYTKKAIKEKWGKDAIVVYPPVDIEKIKPASKENLVVTVGRFVKGKNYETVLEVARLLPTINFMIIGRKQDPNYFEKLRILKPNNVTLLTDLSQEELFREIARAKVYLHTMIGEHFGISIVEAMAAGCIPVVHNSGGQREVVGKLGFLYNDVKDCKECILKAMSKDDTDIHKIITFAKNFSSENFRNRIRNIVKNIVEKH
jgi:alpha-1,2-mannosyltransferase